MFYNAGPLDGPVQILLSFRVFWVEAVVMHLWITSLALSFQKLLTAFQSFYPIKSFYAVEKNFANVDLYYALLFIYDIIAKISLYLLL